jgi:hypothetical protein
MLVNPNDRTIDHLKLSVVRLGYRVHQAIPNASFAPASEAIVGRRIGSVSVGKIAPWRTGAQNPEDAVQNPAIILAARTRPAFRQDRFDNAPLEVRQIVAHDPSSDVSNLESLFALLR